MINLIIKDWKVVGSEVVPESAGTVPAPEEHGDHQSTEDYMELDAGPCIVCGDWCEDTRCDRCKSNMEEDRLNR